MKSGPDSIIKDYAAAFERANGKPSPVVKYEGGWFRFKDQRNQGYRRAKFEEMLAVLRERPAAHPPADRGGASNG